MVIEMTPEAFCAWVEEMKKAGLARSATECGRLLGVGPNTMVRYKREGASKAVALACRALLHRMEPYT